jgi:hypothetical protein
LAVTLGRCYPIVKANSLCVDKARLKVKPFMELKVERLMVVVQGGIR